ncbi:portal protein [Croceibacter phage P2559S]|uniref:portal protein n=1 Tax=Croceibacter phage P2559S TaxID=1176422 RepID=UPI0002688EA6|nr:portal protein [Croceibacter phage P2559S]AFM54789.1 putative phage capsid protein [Croceibacter phage P2559S]
MNAADARAVVNDFLQWVKQLLPKDKYNVFLQLFKFPVSTNELTEEIFNALEKVYDGKDAYEDYNFVNPDYLQDWNDYRSSVLNAYHFWRYEAFKQFKTNINGVMVVDLPAEQTSERPAPYFYFMPITAVKDFKTNASGAIEWIMLPQGDNQLAVIDDEHYSIYQLDEKGEISAEPLTQSAHDLGYCPATMFWGDPLMDSQPALKKSPLSNQLAALDWLLFFQTSKKHLDLYAPYPIYSGFEQDCTYENKENGDYCDSGFIKNSHGDYYVTRTGEVSKCPVCADKRLAGVGSFIEVPLPSRENEGADLRNPVQITTIDKASLDYNVEECERIYDKIYTACVGFGGDISMNKAFNKDQVKANTESRRNVLLSVKKNFERVQAWVEDTVCRLRYGELYVNNTIHYGSDFYLHNVEELTAQYEAAKKAGATDYQLDVIQDQIIETENRNNPNAMERAQVLKHLEPYRHQTRKEVLEMLEAGFGDMELIAVKLNFSTFVLRFERENTDIVEFGNALPFDQKISIILNTFKSYGKTEYTSQPADGGAGSGES